MITRSTGGTLIRVWLVIDGAIFALAAAFNFGFAVTAGRVDVKFDEPIWQAGVGELVIAASLVVAGFSGRRVLAWIAFVASVLGIVFGLSSRRVVDGARDIHVVLVPVAIVLLVMLVTVGRRRAVAPASQP